MKLLRTMLATAIMIAQPIVYAPATAQDYQDPVYDCWVGCIASRPGYEDWCTAECNRRYGNEQTGGGGPERTYYPGPGRQCYGSFELGCNPDVRPN